MATLHCRCVLLVILITLAIPKVHARRACHHQNYNSSFYDATYDFLNGVLRDSTSITRYQSFSGTGCSTRGVLKLAFSNTDNTKKRLLIDFFLNSPTGWVFNLGDSSTNNGFAGDSDTQGRDAELQLNGNLVGYLSDFGGSGMAFNVALPPLTRITLLVSDTQTIWTINGDPITMNYYQNPNWFALNSQSELPGAPVNNDLYLGINQVILPSGRTGSGVCKVGLKFLPVY